MMSERMILLPVSRHVAPPTPGWPPQVRQTGYWFARPQSGWVPPSDLLAFLQAGEPPIVVSLGVMSQAGKQARQGAEIVLQALGEAGVRAIVQGWDEALEGLEIPATVYRAGSLPHGWLFEQVCAVVHHGGFGTTAAALRAGIPAVVVPHIIDQFYWGQRVFEMGVGPQTIPRAQLSATRLSEAIRRTLDDVQMQARAADLGRRIRSEPDGIMAAVASVEGVMK